MNHLEYQIPSLLYTYLASRGMVSLPGLGTLQLIRKPAQNNFADKIMKAFEFQLNFSSISTQVPDEQLHFLERHCKKSKTEIEDQLELLRIESLQKLQVDRKLDWIDVGVFLKDDQDRLSFQPKQQTIEFNTTVAYTHVLRESSSHAMLVGETERSSTEMESYFEEQRRGLGEGKWKIPALVLILLGIAFLFIRFTFGNFNPFEARYNPLNPLTPPATYSIQ